MQSSTIESWPSIATSKFWLQLKEYSASKQLEPPSALYVLRNEHNRIG